jgi:Lrp/AsnC family leucine-responsive transcriptional regulator
MFDAMALHPVFVFEHSAQLPAVSRSRLYDTMEISESTWQHEGDCRSMSQDLREKRLFTYTFSNGIIDVVNKRILEELQREPRLTMSELGRRIGMSSPAVTERVRRLEETGVIRGYRLDLNPAALGLPIAVYIRIRPNPGQLPKIAELAQQIPEIVECHRVTGEDCFIVKAHIPAIDQLDRLLDGFLLYGSTTTSIIQSSPVPLRPPPLPEDTWLEEASK